MIISPSAKRSPTPSARAPPYQDIQLMMVSTKNSPKKNGTLRRAGTTLLQDTTRALRVALRARIPCYHPEMPQCPIHGIATLTSATIHLSRLTQLGHMNGVKVWEAPLQIKTFRKI